MSGPRVQELFDESKIVVSLIPLFALALPPTISVLPLPICVWPEQKRLRAYAAERERARRRVPDVLLVRCVRPRVDREHGAVRLEHHVHGHVRPVERRAALADLSRCRACCPAPVARRRRRAPAGLPRARNATPRAVAREQTSVGARRISIGFSGGDAPCRTCSYLSGPTDGQRPEVEDRPIPPVRIGLVARQTPVDKPVTRGEARRPSSSSGRL